MDMIELIGVKYDKILVTKWSNRKSGKSATILMNEVRSPYSINSPALKTYLDGEQKLSLLFEEKDETPPYDPVAERRKAEAVYADRSLTCTQAAFKLCPNTSFDEYACALHHETACRKYRSQKIRYDN